jgi:dienelactone hydrolase
LILGIEIALFILGIIALATGKLTLTKTRVVYGWPARLLGIIGLLPLPLSFGVGVAIGVLLAMRGEPVENHRGLFIAIEVGIVFGCVALLYGIGLFFVGPPATDDDDTERRSRRRRRRYVEEDEEEADDTPAPTSPPRQVVPTTATCPSCNGKLQMRPELAGRKVRCPKCKNAFTLPEAVAEEEPAQNEREEGITAKPGWYYSRDGKKKLGPVSKRELEEMADEDELLPSHMVRKEGAPKWKPAADVKGLFPERKQSRKRAGSNKLLLGLLAGGVTLVLVAAVIGWIALRKPGTPPGPVAAVNPRAGAPRVPAAAAQPAPAPADPLIVNAGTVAPAEFGPVRMIQPGVKFREATLTRDGVPMRVWHYEPAKAAKQLPLVIVPPAGSTLFTGMDLGDGDRAEQYPYVRAGFAVASFEIDGNMPNVQKANVAQLVNAARAFRAAQAGTANAKAALDFVLAKTPNIDPERIYIAGHSSAATLALQVAAHEPRIKACASYCGVPDLETRIDQALPTLDASLPGYSNFIRQVSPKLHPELLTCPVFLFHAQDDSNVPVQQTTDFAALLQTTNPRVTLVLAPRGGHYDSMMREGIPKGIQWLKGLGK